MPLSAGERLGPYEILAPIGAGGMGEVYKATDTRLGRTVAIKTQHVEHGDRFERESRSIAALNHPNICQLYDVGPNYLVMEFIEGTPLNGPLPLDRACRYTVEIADALSAAHAKGITHRDLKPANILVTASGIKLLDFGLALLSRDGEGRQRAAEATATVGLTQAGVVLGTAAYMSPEQAEAKPVDARSDIFSFGLVFYEMLSGRRAFTGDSAIAIMAAILHKEPEPFDATPALKTILTRCLRKSPADRFQSMTQVKEALLAASPDISRES
jgi:serine/threonine protein kinase